MKIGQLAVATGVSRDTLRFYEERGLIRSQRLENGYRDYDSETETLINYIRTAQKLGFTLGEIGEKLSSLWDVAEPGPLIAQMLAEKLQEIDVRIEALRDLRTQLASRITLHCPLHNNAK